MTVLVKCWFSMSFSNAECSLFAVCILNLMEVRDLCASKNLLNANICLPKYTFWCPHFMYLSYNVRNVSYVLCSAMKNAVTVVTARCLLALERWGFLLFCLAEGPSFMKAGGELWAAEAWLWPDRVTFGP